MSQRPQPFRLAKQLLHNSVAAVDRAVIGAWNISLFTRGGGWRWGQ